jgi:preprotein translocase subunit SecB
MNNSKFQFKGFLIKKSIIVINNRDSNDFNIGFIPSGILNRKENTFILNLETKISDKSDGIDIKVEAEGEFSYENISEEQLENFLYVNASAILFPYIRAYISSLTSLSGIKPINLPTLNLVSLKQVLKENIKEI